MTTSRKDKRVMESVIAIICEVLVVVMKVFVLTAVAVVKNIVYLVTVPKYKNISKDTVLVTGGGKGLGRLVAFEFAKHHPKQVS